MKTLTRGELAKRCGVNFETVRYYEQVGLVPKPARSAANYRVYDPDSIRRIRFIKRAQGLGFTLDEIKELLSLRAKPGAKCAEVSRRARIKIEDIDDKVRMLLAMRQALEALLAQCRGDEGISACPILASLEAEAEAEAEDGQPVQPAVRPACARSDRASRPTMASRIHPQQRRGES